MEHLIGVLIIILGAIISCLLEHTGKMVKPENYWFLGLATGIIAMAVGLII